MNCGWKTKMMNKQNTDSASKFRNMRGVIENKKEATTEGNAEVITTGCFCNQPSKQHRGLYITNH